MTALAGQWRLEPSARDVSKTYASGVVALKATSLEISKGEIFALLGPNGAGKATLISIIRGIVNPSSGAIIADGGGARNRRYAGSPLARPRERSPSAIFRTKPQ